ncbi:increased DNA methylation 2-like [Humulus lupulus]|uniref:increased DNA methylation 2-like n=1 Tax=Humulus lupulus TaxID=3486 RepID=UPI002B401731|nr:increased DNA methylation 2-like [Humulus lupulus]XP_062084710.1 increased DNA methylation 2-like [Humulus lupulus]
MAGSSQAVNANIVTKLGSTNAQTKVADNDQRFLLFFVIGTYFGPDLKGETPQKSVLQRIAEGLPPYTSDQLAGSHIETVEVEHIYRHVLRKAHQSAVVKLPLLLQFFDGNLPRNGDDPTANYPQFPDLFPPLLHPRSLSQNQNKIVENIVFVNNPEIYYIDREDIERFRRLTGLKDFLLDEDAAGLHTTDGVISHSAAVQVDEFNGGFSPSKSSQKTRKTRCMDELLKINDPLQHDRAGSAMVFLPSLPTESELSKIVAATKNGFALTGSAAVGPVGPTVGLMDIGECEDSYIFRMSLPGVKRDERDFSCEVSSEGQVLIRGATTTGEKTVYRYSQMFEMQTQNLCPPGRFSISFKLPGPVDPQQFSGKFGTDGILEGIVMKESWQMK